MDVANAHGKIYRRRLVAQGQRGLLAMLAEMVRRGVTDYAAVNHVTHYAVYFDARS